MKIEIFTHENKEYLIQIGKNKEENDKLCDTSLATDVWFHLENEPSCHVVLKNIDNLKLRDIPRQVIKRCSYLCKINSKSKIQSKSKIMYTRMENVKKTSQIGQVLVEIYKIVLV